MSSSDKVTLIINNNVATITINRPEVRNAFDDEVIKNITSCLESIETNKDIRAVILKGEGKHFSAGADLNHMKKMANFSTEENIADAMQLANMFEKLNYLPKPTIAIIKGAAFGGAVGLAACCDIVIADDTVKFCLSEVKLGISPALISPYVINAIGVRQARRFMLSAEVIDSKFANEIGLIHILNNDLEEKEKEIIGSVLANAPEAIAKTKELIFNITQNSYNRESIKDYTANFIANIRASSEGKEGLDCFLNKTIPHWKN